MRNNMSQNNFFFSSFWWFVQLCKSRLVSGGYSRSLLCILLSCVLALSQRFPEMFKPGEIRETTVHFLWSPVDLTSQRGSRREWGGRLPSAVTTQHALNHKSITSSESHQIDFHRRWLLFSYDDNNSHHPTLLMSLALFWLDSPSVWRKLHSVCL